MGELELLFLSSSGASKLCVQLLVLHTYVAAGWYHGRVGMSVPTLPSPKGEDYCEA
jgi:hypothetical protein